MKFVSSKLLQTNVGRKQARYLITIEVTDYDIEQLEDLAMADLEWYKKESPKEYERLFKWVNKSFWKVFHRLWRIHDQ